MLKTHKIIISLGLALCAVAIAGLVANIIRDVMESLVLQYTIANSIRYTAVIIGGFILGASIHWLKYRNRLSSKRVIKPAAILLTATATSMLAFAIWSLFDLIRIIVGVNISSFLSEAGINLFTVLPFFSLLLIALVAIIMIVKQKKVRLLSLSYVVTGTFLTLQLSQLLLLLAATLPFTEVSTDSLVIGLFALLLSPLFIAGFSYTLLRRQKLDRPAAYYASLLGLLYQAFIQTGAGLFYLPNESLPVIVSIGMLCAVWLLFISASFALRKFTQTRS